MVTKADEVMYIIQINVSREKQDQMKDLINRLVVNTSKEPGVLHYHWSIDGNAIQSIEHFKDSKSTLSHLLNFQKNYAKEYMSLGDVVSTVVYGNPSADVTKVLDGFGATYRQTIDSI